MVDPSFIGQMPVLSELPDAEREALAGLIHEREFSRGSMIFSEGQPADAVCFVRTGRVKVYKLTSEGLEQIMGVFESGDGFGMVAAVGHAPYPASATALDDSRIWLLSRLDLQAMIQKNPAVASAMMQEMGTRLRWAQQRVHSLAAHPLRHRLAEYLLAQAPLAERQGRRRVRLNMTHQELGAYLGASRETVTRALADMRRQGLIEVRADELMTLDVEGLKDCLV